MSGKVQQNHGTIDSSRLESAFANVFEVLSVPGEIGLLFGNAQAVTAKRDDLLPASLDTRIIMSPYIAKRFAALLSDKIREYEAVFGPLTEEITVPATSAKSSMRAVTPRYVSEKVAEKANFLMQLVDDLDVEYGLERSFKAFEGSLLTNRFILGIKKDDLPQNSCESTISIFRKMGMPDRLLNDCSGLLHRAAFIHFGFEEQRDSCLYKAYLEFKTDLKFGVESPGIIQEPFLVFLGLKWDPFDTDKCAKSEYTCYPLLSLDEIQEKLSGLYERNPDVKSFETAKNILNKTVKIISNNKIVYEEVSEENNPRKSFDINLYGANLHIRDIYPFLLDIGRHYSLPAEQFMPLCDRIRDKKLGHLSGGVDREGKDFITVYYGVEGINKKRPTQAETSAP